MSAACVDLRIENRELRSRISSLTSISDCPTFLDYKNNEKQYTEYEAQLKKMDADSKRCFLEIVDKYSERFDKFNIMAFIFTLPDKLLSKFIDISNNGNTNENSLRNIEKYYDLSEQEQMVFWGNPIIHSKEYNFIAGLFVNNDVKNRNRWITITSNEYNQKKQIKQEFESCKRDKISKQPEFDFDNEVKNIANEIKNRPPSPPNPYGRQSPPPILGGKTMRKKSKKSKKSNNRIQSLLRRHSHRRIHSNRNGVATTIYIKRQKKTKKDKKYKSS